MASMDQDVGNMNAEEIQKILEGHKLYSTLHDRFKTMSLDENLLRGIYASLTLYASVSKKKEVVGIDAKNTHNIVNGGGVHQVHDTFESMGLEENLLKGIHALGYEKPSVIQRRGMVPFCRGLDVVGEAHPGSGKTATFCVGILQQLDYNLQECQALVLAPHGDLANRIENDMNALAGDYVQVKVHACVRGTSIKEDIRILESGVVHVVVGTPARVSSLLRHGALRSDYIKMFVLDEADELLSDAFEDWIHDILNWLPRKFQIGIFSNTVLPPQAIQMTRKFMKNPVCVFVKGDETSLEGIKQFLVSVDEEENKLDALCDLCDVYGALALTQSVIFLNTREKVDWLAEKMRARDHAVSAIHEYMDDNTREIIMREFRSGSSRVLITTDLLDRGINVRQFFLVINYDLPLRPINYLLRLDRIGRLDWNSVAIFNFVTPANEKMVQNIQRFYNMAIEDLKIRCWR